MNKYYYCFDVGGTFIKSAIIDKDYKILYQEKTSTEIFYKTNSLAQTILEIAKSMEESSGLKISDCSGFGCGFPGLVDNDKGEIKYIHALDLSNEKFRKELSKSISVPINIANDAECATIAEHKLGIGKNYSNLLMLTIGTGIGSGIIINNQPLRNVSPYSCEIGHMILEDGKTFQQLASTRALENQIKDAMIENPDSKMWQNYTDKTATAKTVFEYKDIDETAKNVFDNYIRYLGTGLTNVLDIFNPDAIIIGGGVSNQKESLIGPLSDFVNSHIFTRKIGFRVKILTAKLTNDAGVLGARCLFD